MQRGKLIKFCLSLLGGMIFFLLSGKGSVVNACVANGQCLAPGQSTSQCCSNYAWFDSGCYITESRCHAAPTPPPPPPPPPCVSNGNCVGIGETCCSGWSNFNASCFLTESECAVKPDPYCDLNKCPDECETEDAYGGVCNDPPSCLSTDTCLGPGDSQGDCCSGYSNYDPSCPLTESSCVIPQCLEGTKCEDSVYSECEYPLWVEKFDCPLGCDGDVCNEATYCKNTNCSECDVESDDHYDEDGYYTVDCWEDESEYNHIDLYPKCLPVDGSSCVVGECHPVTSTCGGTITEARCDELYPGLNYVSHIDNCGGQDCGPPCVGGGCIPEYPTKPTLLLPVDGGVSGEDVSLSWDRSDYGVGCPPSNSQDLYLEAGDSSPDVKIADLNSGLSAYDVSGLESGTVYYWRVVASNGDLSMSSDTFSFSVDGLIDGYFFDSGGLSVCPADLSDPAYDSRKIGGGMMDITGTGDYLDVTTIADGSYLQSVIIPGSYVLGNFRLGSGFVSTPDLVCDGSSVEFVVGGAGVAVRSFGFLQDYDGWWQAVGGDV